MGGIIIHFPVLSFHQAIVMCDCADKKKKRKTGPS
jgi:hypothetical protein